MNGIMAWYGQRAQVEYVAMVTGLFREEKLNPVLDG